MPTAKLLSRAREAAERLMTDTCSISRPTGAYTTDPDTGSDVPEVVSIYTGKCKLSSTPQSGDQRDSEASRFTLESLRLHLPITAPVRVGDLVTVTGSETDPLNVGMSWELFDLNRGTHRSAQRWTMEVPTR